ncbi:MAG: acetyl-CoA carboxylase biotin carboxylase subunit, partial [Synechococcus sp.]|nr:acetyl-CoA carboxylase biotin carboxylase subunit [Synechococcus sp.]
PGTISGWLPPGGPGVRIDSHVYTGYDIPPFYDSLIGKLIIWAEDRPSALLRLKRALSECAVIGVPTTIDFHLALLERPEFQNAQVHTKFVEQEMLSSEK